MSHAPIAIFVFNRPEHTRRTLSALVTNAELASTPTYVFCDGPRSDADLESVDAARRVVREFDLPNLRLFERDKNMGLASSISTGVSSVCEEHGRVIVLEDDLHVSRHFLAYMNAGLDRFADSERVMQISGHCYHARGFEQSDGSSLMPFISSWGWATWKRAWSAYDPSMSGYHERMKDADARREFDLRGAMSFSRMVSNLERANRLHQSWGVRWYWSVFKSGGLALFPHRTLVEHFGVDGSGTNVRGRQDRIDIGFDPENRVLRFPEEVRVDEKLYGAVRRTLAAQQTLWKRGLRFLRRYL